MTSIHSKAYRLYSSTIRFIWSICSTRKDSFLCVTCRIHWKCMCFLLLVFSFWTQQQVSTWLYYIQTMSMHVMRRWINMAVCVRIRTENAMVGWLDLRPKWMKFGVGIQTRYYLTLEISIKERSGSPNTEEQLFALLWTCWDMMRWYGFIIESHSLLTFSKNSMH